MCEIWVLTLDIGYSVLDIGYSSFALTLALGLVGPVDAAHQHDAVHGQVVVEGHRRFSAGGKSPLHPLVE